MRLYLVQRAADAPIVLVDGTAPYAIEPPRVEAHYTCGHGFFWQRPSATFYPPELCPTCEARRYAVICREVSRKPTSVRV